MRSAIMAILALASAGSAFTQQPAPDGKDWLVEFRELKSDAGGLTGYVLTIDRAGQATIQKLPSGPGHKVLHTKLTCEEHAEIPEVLNRELPQLRPSYGSEHGQKNGELSVVSRWSGPEQRVVWHNPPSKPEPPGGWYAIEAYMENIERRAEDEAKSASQPQHNGIVYWRSSSGIVGAYIHTLNIDDAGNAVLVGGLHGFGRRGATHLSGEELAALLRAFAEAKFLEFRQCYGRYAPVNPQDTGIGYAWDGKHNDVKWMSAPAGPKPPDGWSKITDILDKVWARADQERQKN